MPVGARAVRLETGHDPHQEVALTGQRTDRGGDRERGDAGDLAEQASTIQAIRAEPLRDGEDDLPVRHGCEERGVEPLGPDGEAFRVAAGTEVPTLAGEREQVLVGTGVTPDAREAVLEDAAGEELVRDLADHGAPRAVLVREALVVHRLQTVYDERFAHEYGPWRPVVAQVTDKFLACGILPHGFARIRCDACAHEYLRAYCLYRRRLLGEIARVAARTVTAAIRTLTGERDLAVGIVACLQTHGSRANWHPHLHLLVTEGGFRPDGTFVSWPAHDTARLTEAFRRAVLRLFVRLDLFDEDQAHEQSKHGAAKGLGQTRG